MANITSMNTKIFCKDDDNDPIYEVNFQTHNRDFYEKVVAACRECIDGKENIKEDIRTEIDLATDVDLSWFKQEAQKIMGNWTEENKDE